MNPWEKVVVTVDEYNNWIAQLYGANIRAFPKVKPTNMPIEIYNELKKKYVVPTKIRVKKKSATSQVQELKVESRYMDWQKNQRH